MTKDSELRFCIKHGITIKQLYILYMLRSGVFNSPKSLGQLYVKKVESFSAKVDVIDLEKKGLIENFNSPGKYLPEMFMLTSKSDSLFVTANAGEELWNAYPGTFPINGGKLFIARSGIDFDEFGDFYIKSIDFNAETHIKVLESVKTYVTLVEQGKLNGKKIVDFVKERVWDSLPSLDDDKWGTDV